MSTQSFGGAHRDRVCMCMFIEVSVCACICALILFKRKSNATKSADVETPISLTACSRRCRAPCRSMRSYMHKWLHTRLLEIKQTKTIRLYIRIQACIYYMKMSKIDR